MAGIFVSHAHADGKFLEPFIDQVIKLGSKLDTNDLFYSSEIETGIPAGGNLNTYIQGKVENAGLVIAVISPSFRASPYCLAELGAAWARVGTLLPIAVPGFQYTDLDGVLNGLAVRHIDDSGALDELHDRIIRVTKSSVPAATWVNHKQRWLAKVDEQIALLPTVTFTSPDEAKELRNNLQESRGALKESMAEVEELKEKLEQLAKLKDSDEVADLLVPKEERARFDHLVNQAARSMSALPKIACDALWYDLHGKTMFCPSRMEDTDKADQAGQACDDGYLIDDDGELTLDTEHQKVHAAVKAVAKLNHFLQEGRSEEFDSWFVLEYDRAPGNLTRQVWDAIF